MIRWIFFDMGNVILNTDAAMAYLYAELHRTRKELGQPGTFGELLQEREATIARTGAGHWSVLTRKYLGEDGHRALAQSTAQFLRSHYLDYHNVLPGMNATLQTLSKSFSLAVVANQMTVADAALRATGLRDFFEFLVLSESIGLAKPDPGLYRWALMRAECAPAEAIMIGDRVDNDILPARALGLWTLWFSAPHREKRLPAGDTYREQYQASQLRRSTASIGPVGPEDTPDGRAQSAAELVEQVGRIATAAS